MQNQPEYDPIKATQVQLSRLFGEKSKDATADLRTKAQWRRTLRKVLGEIEAYLNANVDTDEFHRLIIYSGIVGAREALKQEDFWPGYVEGITRIALCLLGQYPDHRRRKPGRRDAEFYKLNRERTVQWIQTPDQRLKTLLYAGEVGFPELSERPREVLGKFRARFGYSADYAAFLEWYRVHYAKDYAAIFR